MLWVSLVTTLRSGATMQRDEWRKGAKHHGHATERAHHQAARERPAGLPHPRGGGGRPRGIGARAGRAGQRGGHDRQADGGQRPQRPPPARHLQQDPQGRCPQARQLHHHRRVRAAGLVGGTAQWQPGPDRHQHPADDRLPDQGPGPQRHAGGLHRLQRHRAGPAQRHLPVQHPGPAPLQRGGRHQRRCARVLQGRRPGPSRLAVGVERLRRVRPHPGGADHGQAGGQHLHRHRWCHPGRQRRLPRPDGQRRPVRRHALRRHHPAEAVERQAPGRDRAGAHLRQAHGSECRRPGQLRRQPRPGRQQRSPAGGPEDRWCSAPGPSTR